MCGKIYGDIFNILVRKSLSLLRRAAIKEKKQLRLLLARPQESVFRAWARIAKLRQASTNQTKQTRKETKKYNEEIEENMQEAEKRGTQRCGG